MYVTLIGRQRIIAKNSREVKQDGNKKRLLFPMETNTH